MMNEKVIVIEKSGQSASAELSELCNLYLEHCYYEKRLSENSLQSYRYDLIGLVRYAESYISRSEKAGSCGKTETCGGIYKTGETKQEKKNDEASTLNETLIEKLECKGNAKNAQYRPKQNCVYIKRLDRDFWHKYMAELAALKKVKTVKRKLACFTGFFYFLENRGIIEENPLDKFKLKLKPASSVPETLSLKEMKCIFDAVYRPLRDNITGITKEMAEILRCRDIAVLELLFATGLRVNELCSMNFSTYDKDEQSVRILGKGGKERKLYLCNNGVINALGKYIEKRVHMDKESDAIFLNRWGKPLSCQAVRDLVRKYCKAAGIKRNITPHAFRHTFASLMKEEGVELRYIQEFLGHSSITTTQIYLHTSEKRKREILTKMHPRKKLEK